MRPVRNILFVDDDHMSNIIHEMLIQSLRPEIDVRTCSDSTEALQSLKQLVKTDPAQFPDIIFIDLCMPGMNGWEFLEELKKFSEFIFKECNVYLLSSSIDFGDIEKAKEFTMLSDFISKPLPVERLQTLFTLERNLAQDTL